jgi:hypothetical protein
MKERTTSPGPSAQIRRRADLSVAPPRPEIDTGIEVQEEQCGTVTAQRVYKMRCECGRSWFELELPKGVRCPACHKFGIVSD